MKLPLLFTATFTELYERLPASDFSEVSAALDDLEEGHDRPEMRNVIHIGSAVLFTTPRIYSPGGVYRITWQYDHRDLPTAIVCITVASVET